MQTNAGKTSIHSAYHMYRREELLERRGQSERDHLLGIFLRKLHDANTFLRKKTLLWHWKFRRVLAGSEQRGRSACWATNTDTAFCHTVSSYDLVICSPCGGGVHMSLRVRLPTACNGTETNPECCLQPSCRYHCQVSLRRCCPVSIGWSLRASPQENTTEVEREVRTSQ